jgi:hypothetical protein
VRTVHWLFVVSVVLFLTGLGFIIAGARAITRAPAAPPAEAGHAPTATVKQLMKGIIAPAADRVFASVQYVSTPKGEEEKAPRTPEEWEAVGNDAAALVESGHLILMEGRAPDRKEWSTITEAMIEAATGVLRAAEAKSPDKVMEFGGQLNETCDSCHGKYRRGR